MRSDGHKQLRALICKTFGNYSFAAVDALSVDDFAELAGSALWLQDREAEANKPKKGRRR